MYKYFETREKEQKKMSEVVLDSAAVHSKLAKISSTWTKVSILADARSIFEDMDLATDQSNLVIQFTNQHFFNRYTKRRRMHKHLRLTVSSL